MFIFLHSRKMKNNMHFLIVSIGGKTEISSDPVWSCQVYALEWLSKIKPILFCYYFFSIHEVPNYPVMIVRMCMSSYLMLFYVISSHFILSHVIIIIIIIKCYVMEQCYISDFYILMPMHSENIYTLRWFLLCNFEKFGIWENEKSKIYEMQ